MPKVKIGEKVVAGAEKNQEKKVFTNGHKSFTSAECRLLIETQAREKQIVKTFDDTKYNIVRPRNPLTGEETPRVYTDKINGTVLRRTGDLLMKAPSSKSEDDENSMFSQGSARSNNTLGSSYTGRSGIEDKGNPLKRSDRTVERIHALQNLQDNISGEIEYLKIVMRDQQNGLLGSTRDFRF